MAELLFWFLEVLAVMLFKLTLTITPIPILTLICNSVKFQHFKCNAEDFLGDQNIHTRCEITDLHLRQKSTK